MLDFKFGFFSGVRFATISLPGIKIAKQILVLFFRGTRPLQTCVSFSSKNIVVFGDTVSTTAA